MRGVRRVGLRLRCGISNQRRLSANGECGGDGSLKGERVSSSSPVKQLEKVDDARSPRTIRTYDIPPECDDLSIAPVRIASDEERFALNDFFWVHQGALPGVSDLRSVGRPAMAVSVTGFIDNQALFAR